MKILHASSELHPYSKSGGLADMVGALTKSLAGAGHQVAVVTPLYRDIRERFPELRRADLEISVPLGTRTVSAEVWLIEPTANQTIYFIEQPGFYDRAGLYQENGVDYPDNAERFIFFAKCVVSLARSLPLGPEIVHVHDWQVGLAPLFIRQEKLQAGWGTAPATCLTVHNLAFQGIFPRAKYPLTNLPWDYFNPEGVEFYGSLSCLKAGILYADMITTVSPRYAREITTEALGCGLDGVLRGRQDSLVGILNGIDCDEWNTTRNPHLPFPYSPDHLEGKTQCKLALQRELGLPETSAIPLFGSISRLADQKGVDIQFGALEEMLATDMQFVLLGSGSTPYERAYQNLAQRFPQKVAVTIGYNHALSHRIEAAADFFLMPSRFEPSGLNQMYSLRYGTIPIVRATGGLDDSVIDITEDADQANGIKFYEYSARALAKAIRKALVLFASPQLLAHYRANGMSADFSWEKTESKNVEVYEAALQKSRGRLIPKG